MKAETTKKKMKDSFLTLAKENEIHKISITNVVGHAQVSRGTFYTHYENIHRMIEDIGNDILRDLYALSEQCMPTAASPTGERSGFEQMAWYIHDRQDTFLLLLGEYGDPEFLHKWILQFRSLLLNRLKCEEVQPDTEIEKIAEFLSTSSVKMIRDSLQSNQIAVTLNTLDVTESIMRALAVSHKHHPMGDYLLETPKYLY